MLEHLSTLKTTRREKIKTRKLDDVLDLPSIDFLKLDVQGAELMALRGATKLLQKTYCIHCEVEFSPIYDGQPLFHEVARFLDRKGFYLGDLLIPHRYYYHNSENVTSNDRLMRADAVFFLKTLDAAILRSQALSAALIYKKFSMATHLLEKADEVARST